MDITTTMVSAVSVLNDALKKDPTLVECLTNNRVPLTYEGEDFPLVSLQEEGMPETVGLVGVLNGIFYSDSQRITAMYDNETNKLKGFAIISIKPPGA